MCSPPSQRDKIDWNGCAGDSPSAKWGRTGKKGRQVAIHQTACNIPTGQGNKNCRFIHNSHYRSKMFLFPDVLNIYLYRQRKRNLGEKQYSKLNLENSSLVGVYVNWSTALQLVAGWSGRCGDVWALIDSHLISHGVAPHQAIDALPPWRETRGHDK